ncbi:MAG: MMPL family transporter [Deltaproteobacteria bacterium]|nr:MMPL family transporter [Deltaproteobacteria bacterium]
MERFYHLIVHRPKSVLLLILLLTGFFVFHARHVHESFSIESLFSPDDPEKQYYEQVRRLFGSDEVGIVGLITDNIYTPEVLQQLKRLTEEVHKVDGVASALSLTNAVDPVADVVDPPLLMPQIPSMTAELQELQRKLADRPLYLGTLVSPDGRAAAINIVFREMNDDEFIQLDIDNQIQALVDREQGPAKVYYVGVPHWKAVFARAMGESSARLDLWAALLVMAGLFLSFRSLRGLLLPVSTGMVSLAWTFGVVGLTGGQLSMGAIITLPILLQVLGLTYAFHIVAEYYELAHSSRAKSEVVLETMRRTSPPILITALITVPGFLSLCLNRLGGIQEMGVYSAAGVIVASFLAMTLTPALLSLLPLPVRHEHLLSPAVSLVLRRLGWVDFRYRRVIIGVSLLLVPLAVWQIFSIQAATGFQAVFRKDDPISRADQAIRPYFGDAVFHVVIDSEEQDRMKQWDTVRKIRDLQLSIDALPKVHKTVSFVDYYLLLDRGIQEGEGGIEVSPEGKIGETPQLTHGSQTTFLDNPEQWKGVLQLLVSRPPSFAPVVNTDFSRANIMLLTTLDSPQDLAATGEKIQQFAHEHLPSDLHVRFVGNSLLQIRIANDFRRGHFQSLALAVGVVFAVMSAIFLSVRVGIIALLPTLFPMVIFLGLIGASGAVLGLGTSTLAIVVLGLAIDYTVHLMTRLSFELRTDAAQEHALLQTLVMVGKPNLYLTVIFCLNFLVSSFAAFAPIRASGLLLAAAMIATLAANVVLLPALLASTRILTVWDLLYTVTQLTQRLEQRVAERTQELQEVNRQLETASRHKSEFLARMSHELRTPMNAIIGFTRLVMRRCKDVLPKREHENLRKVLISSEHLLALINDILDLAKVEAGRMEVHAIRFELDPLLNLCLHTVEPLLKSERLQLVKELEGGIPELFTDQDKLKQILMNLLSNAVKFTEAGTITLTARHQGGQVIIAVADTGIGIPMDQLALVFEEFHQVDSSSTRQYSGTGLGLSISRHFAQLLGGDITIQSTVGVGSTFTVTVPLRYDTALLTTHVAVAPSREALTTAPKTDVVALAIENPAEVNS